MNIYVSAYLDKNLGDDLMIRMLANCLSEHQLYIYCTNDKHYTPFKDIMNLQKCDIPIHKINSNGSIRFHACVIIGGSIYIYDTYTTIFKRYIRYFLKKNIKNKNIKIATIGCNLGPFKNEFARKTAIKDLRLSQLITVRDNESFDIVSEYIPYNVYKYPDIVFSLKDLLDFDDDIESRSSLGISVYNNVRQPNLNSDYISAMAKIADEYIEKTGNNVKLLAFDTGEENDMKSAKLIFRACNYKNKVNIIGHSDDGSTILSEMNQCSSLVATRFHSIILAFKLHIPFIPIVYSNKSENFLKDIEYNKYQVNFEDCSSIDHEKFVADLIDLESSKFNPRFDLEESSNGHFLKLSDFLNNTGRN
jgi:Uncharacterized conserved protein